MKHLTLLFTLLFFTLTSMASHIPGGNVSYECVGPNTFLVTLTIYEDCATAFLGPTDQTITITNDCGIPGLTSATLTNVVFQNPFAPLCPADLPNSTCNGGTLPGMYEHIWQGTVTVPADCDAWHFAYTSCCRNAANNLSNGTGESFYWEATINSATSPCNNSSLSNDKIRYLCANQLNVINMNPFDPDGDSLHLSFLDAPTSGTGGTVIYQPPYTGSDPITGITIDSNTGIIEVTPTMVGNYVVDVLIEEFDSTGALVGTRIIDMQFYVVNCASNDIPGYNGISGLTGATTTDSITLSSCAGQNLCFDISVVDTNATDSVFISPDFSAMPGATFNQTSFTSPATGTICWNIPPGSSGLAYLPVSFADNACPFNAEGSRSFIINIDGGLALGSDATVCNGDSIVLSGFSDSTYWQAISGPALVVGTNISCNPCANPIFTPGTSTQIEATDNSPGICTGIDSIMVDVVPGFSAILTTGSDSLCLNEQTTIDLTPTPPDTYVYAWNNSGNLDNYNIEDPNFTANIAGTVVEQVTVTSSAGCSKTFNVSVFVRNGMAPTSTIIPSDTNYVCGMPLTLTASASGTGNYNDDFDSGTVNGSLWNDISNGIVNADCGSSAGPLALHFDSISGPRHAETNPLNLTNCTSLDYCLFIANTASGGAPCENADAGENVVFEYSTDGGTVWTQIILHDQGDWDANPNWQCFSIPVPVGAATSSTILRWAQTNYSACMGCDNWALDEVNLVCSGDLSYSWTPSAGLTTPDSGSTDLFIPTDSTTYYLYLLDTLTGCDYTASIDIVPTCDTCQLPIPTFPPTLSCTGDVNGQIQVNLFGPDGPFTVVLSASGTTIDSVTNIVSDTLFTGLGAGTYTVTSISSSGCSSDSTFTISEPSPLMANALNDTSLCEGEFFDYSGSASGGTGSISYFWSTGDTGVGPFNDTALVSSVIILTATDQNGCSAKDSLIITVNPTPVVSMDPFANDTVCANGGFVILPAATPAGGSYSGAAVTGNVFDPSIAGPGSFPIFYTYTDSNGCTATDADFITVEACTGIQESETSQIAIYPNPVKDLLYISSSKVPRSINVLTIEGKLIWASRVSASTFELNTEGWDNGSYLLEIHFENNSVSRKVFVKQ